MVITVFHCNKVTLPARISVSRGHCMFRWWGIYIYLYLSSSISIYIYIDSYWSANLIPFRSTNLITTQCKRRRYAAVEEPTEDGKHWTPSSITPWPNFTTADWITGLGRAQLDQLRSYMVGSVCHCKMWSNFDHEYLVFEILLPTGGVTHVVCQREIQGEITGALLRTLPALNHILIGPEATNHQRPTDQDIRTLIFRENLRPSVMDLGLLLQLMHEHAPRYKVASTQCFWFAKITFKLLKMIFNPNDIPGAAKNMRQTFWNIKWPVHGGLVAIQREYMKQMGNYLIWGTFTLVSWPDVVGIQENSLI